MPSPTIDAIIAAAQGEMQTLAGRVAEGEMKPSAWIREMRITLTRQWAGAYQAGLGREPTQQELKWLEREYNKHDRFLRGFRDDIASGKLTPVQIEARANMYGDRLRGLYEAGRAAGHELVLPFVPGSGHTQCLVNCRCHCEFTEEEGKPIAIWVMDPAAEHCPDCEKLNGLPHTEWKAAIGE